MKSNLRKKGPLILSVFLILTGVLIILLPMILQDWSIKQATEEYETLKTEVLSASAESSTETDLPDSTATDIPPTESEEPEPVDLIDEDKATETEMPEEEPKEESPGHSSTATGTSPGTGANLTACLQKNADFIAWLKIPGTRINYPVVQSDDTEYYLTHTFNGTKSKLGCLFSLTKSDYQTPGKNIAIYGHHITSSGQKMFRPLIFYKKQSFYAKHSTVYLDSLYHSETYTIFAVIDMHSDDWDPSTASFSSDAEFLAFVERAKEQSLYDTGVEVNADDHILTLITCDRTYDKQDGRLIVMAVAQ